MGLFIYLPQQSVNADFLSLQLRLSLEPSRLSNILSSDFGAPLDRGSRVVVTITQTAILVAKAGEMCLVWCGVRSRRDAR